MPGRPLMPGTRSTNRCQMARDSSREGWSVEVAGCQGVLWIIVVESTLSLCMLFWPLVIQSIFHFNEVGLHIVYRQVCIKLIYYIHLLSCDFTQPKSHSPAWSLINGESNSFHHLPKQMFEHVLRFVYLYIYICIYMCVCVCVNFHMSMRFLILRDNCNSDKGDFTESTNWW